MRTPIAHLATPRRALATECCVAVLAAAAIVLAGGATTLALAVLGACALTMVPAVVALTALERRGLR
jgi:hypothetical protein